MVGVNLILKRNPNDMAILGFQSTKENGLSFELLVDGQPLGMLIGARDTAIPYWIIKDDLPYLPPHGKQHDPEIRIVCVCSCGEYGCGHTRCRVVHEGDNVILRNFDVDVSREGSKKEFHFSLVNYKEVIAEIVNLASQKQRLARSWAKPEVGGGSH